MRVWFKSKTSRTVFVFADGGSMTGYSCGRKKKKNTGPCITVRGNLRTCFWVQQRGIVCVVENNTPTSCLVLYGNPAHFALRGPVSDSDLLLGSPEKN